MARLIAEIVVSFGFYAIYWHYLTWKQLRRDSDGARPLWHAIGFVVPLWSLVITHRHAAEIRARSRSAGLAPSVRPRVVAAMIFLVGAALLAQFIFLSVNTLDSELTELVIALVMDAFDTALLLAIVFWSQRDLNAVWRSEGGAAAREARLEIKELIPLGIGAFIWINSMRELIGFLTD